MNGVESLAYNETFNCVQCGYCLPACPTYKTMKKETHSPRGRINLVKMAAEGKISIDKLMEPIDLCLGCRACERVCPTNVQYGAILESAKEVLQQKKTQKMSYTGKTVKNMVYNQFFPKKQNLTMAGHLLWFYQKTGLKSVAHSTGLINILPENLAAFDNVIPAVPSPAARKRRLQILKPNGEVKYRVAFFTGCVMDAVFHKINDLSMKLLQAGGCEVTIIPEQTCCGALHSHSGEVNLAKELAKKNIGAFENVTYDYLINNAGGCGAMLNEYGHLLKDEPEWKNRADKFALKSIDISVLLSKLELPLKKEIDKIATYQPSCHMKNVQKVDKEPLALMSSIKGLSIRRMENEDMCCGSAGVYNIVNYKESMKILDEKMIDMKKTAPHVIVTTNPGCLLQMKLGIDREKMNEKTEAVHLVELLAESCEIS
ncbi:(Fe-S)-binding protein [Bacillus sp. ISL-47]|uniref:(Fe-S)-binding protein n=1 Tax=Bacillus sp. ISL-47 TaxID=2819130 RepID=UPI001BE72C45|nr:(Fe-S)-binding protein [Bacillus sp. ISL-47]MBT2689794.1 (Fe-S)-binding protein [Bacillus sp. ISL-47]MBT2709242.1 (Fe-S)-binding protein [Pseudomonas sp. ISL-84]